MWKEPIIQWAVYDSYTGQLEMYVNYEEAERDYEETKAMKVDDDDYGTVYLFKAVDMDLIGQVFDKEG